MKMVMESGDFSWPRVIGGTLIVGGTATGAGILALPVVTAMGGFFPSMLVYFLCWIFSIATGLLFLEICLWMPQDANIISMAHHLLGPIGKACAWMLYLFLFYCLTIAYISGGAEIILSFFGGIPRDLAIIVFTLFFGAFIYIGTRAVDRLNTLLMVGLITTYLMFVFFGIKSIHFDHFKQVNWFASFLAIPVIFTSFSYQGVIPSLNTYLNRNPHMMRIAIIAGTSIPFLAYIVWSFLILGIIPLQGPHGLLQAKAAGMTSIEPLQYALNNSKIWHLGRGFGFFALTTSFLGVTLGLLDFLSDALQVKKEGLKKLFLCCLIYLPPMFIAMTYPGIFLKALGYAGGIGCALLLGLFPILMVWSGRYKKGYPKLDKQLFGGKAMLALLACFIAFELFFEVFQELFSR